MSEETPFVISPAADVLASESAAAPARWGRRLAVSGAGLAVVVLAGGGYAAYGALSGGGTQPETFVPANAVAYVELDLDPPAGQKINSVRLLHKLPRDVVKSTSSDFRDLLLSTVFASDGSVNYDQDIKPWLGQRVAIALLPPIGGGKPVPEGVLQVTDEAAFKKAAPRLFKTPDDGGYVLRGGFVIIADDADVAARVADSAAKADLADYPDYNVDTKSLGDRVVTGWYDASRAASLLPTAAPGLASSFKGRGVFAVRVDSDAVELVANQTGGTPYAGGKAALMGKLPSDTIAAVEITGAGARVAAQWNQLLLSFKATGVNVSAMVDRLEKRYDITLPQDLETILGSDTLVAATAADGASLPAFGYLSVTDKAKAKALIARAGPTLEGLGAPVPELTGNGIAWGTSPTWAKDAQGGDLGASAGFKDALPDAASAQFALYVDIAAATHLRFAQTLAGGAASAVDDVDVRGLGITASVDGSTSHIRIRLTVK